jgi:cell division protein FtsB
VQPQVTVFSQDCRSILDFLLMLGEDESRFPLAGVIPEMKVADLPMSDKTAPPTVSTSRRLPLWPLGAIAVVFLFALFSNRGVLHILKLKKQQADLRQQLEQVEAVNAGLRKEIASLNTDRHHLERLARSQLGMVRDDEVVYQFASKKHPDPSVPSSPVAEASR